MDYLMKASGLVILLFLFYQLFLKNETFFKSIRSYFLIGLIIVITLPLLEIPIYVEYISQQVHLSRFEEMQVSEITGKSIDWIVILQTIYLIGIVFFSLKFIVQLISISYLIFSHKKYKKGNHFYIETSKDITPFSFFNYIVFNNKQFSSTELEQIINHEKAHAMQWHSLDTLLAHILVILLWFNPFVWFYKKAVQQNLEFLADSYALELAENQKFYQLTLLKVFQKNYCTQITNNFYNSLIKKRITMLHKNRSTSKNQWKYALLIPLLIAFVFAFNTKTIAQEIQVIEVVENQKNFVEIINKDFQKNDLELVIKRLKADGIEFSYSNLKFNSNDEIIKISIKAKNETSKVSATWEQKNNTIPTIYVGENNGQLIASSSPKNDYANKKYKSGDVKFLNNEELKKANYVFVTSDGETKTWTPKDGKKDKIIVKEIHKNDKDQVLFLSSDNEKPIVYVDGELSDNNALESTNPNSIKSVSVLKGEAAMEQYGEKGKNGLILITTKENKKSVNLLNSDKEIDASENVYIIKSDEKGKKDKIIKSQNFIKFSSTEEQPLYILNEKEITSKEMEGIDPNTIKAINVLKDEAAVEKYGDKGKNGVIIITLKKE
ncbi:MULTISPECIES: M56 family metallopeptidase [Flavobacteriaceae]|uniref:M56 family peptidase n=2 Tax=Flavobacteriaceae TaxID=49546 RepID=A0A4Y8AW46_9FLAO|nr:MULTISPECIES: M56 family metallopeptidase [Flavobacteriaceae]TEW75586.1 M56 family peptidase [Gramella jeungdoensis]GGK46432.1 hypothetical protein GCM10007963_13370 [Lutibacter litoralis]